MDTETMKLKDIHPAAYNPRVELKPGDDEYEALKNSIDRFGLTVPLVVNKTTGNLVSGHQRYNVLKAEGATEAEVVLVEEEPEREKLLNVALNRIEGDWDYEKLEALLKEFDEEDIKFTGFSEEELKSLIEEFDEDAGDAEQSGTASGAGDGAAESHEFNVYLTFSTKESAESWLEGHGIDQRYGGALRNLTVRMEGTEYGTGN